MIKMNNDRNNMRSFRFSDNVLKAIESFAGTSINDKFNNLVQYCFESVPNRLKQLEQIKKDIEAEDEKYMILQKKMQTISRLIQQLQTVERDVNEVLRTAKIINENEIK